MLHETDTTDTKEMSDKSSADNSDHPITTPELWDDTQQQTLDAHSKKMNPEQRTLANSVPINDASGTIQAKQSTTIQSTSQGTQFIRIPHSHTSVAQFTEGDEIHIKTINFNGQLCLFLHNNTEANGVSRNLRSSRRKQPEHALTLPKKIVTATSLADTPITYRSSKQGITVFTKRTRLIADPVSLKNPEKVMISKHGNGSYRYYMSQEQYEQFAFNGSVGFWCDTLGDEFVFGIEPNPENVQWSTIKLSIQNNSSENTETTSYFVYIPKTVCNSLDMDGRYMEWGYNSKRLLGRTLLTA